MAGGPATAVLRHLPLVDAHCHQLLVQAPDDMGRLLTEGDEPGWDTAVGLAVRRWCGPALDLPPLATPAAYLERRAELGHDAVTARLLGAARLSHLLVDTGPSGPDLALPAVGAVHDVVRLELVAEELAATAVTPADFAAAFAERLDAACRDAVAVKSIVAYRHGLDLDPARPAPAEVRDAAEEWLVELAPFTKVLYSSDGYRLPELYLAGAAQFRHSFGAVLDGWVGEGAMAGDDAERVARLVGVDNARRVYRLPA